MQRFSDFLHFCGLTSFEIYWCVFGKTKRFFPTFFGLSSREFDQKNQFLKNEKNFVKNLQKRPFFCSFEGGKAPMSTPNFDHLPYESVQNGVLQKWGVDTKAFPPTNEQKNGLF